MMNDEGQDVKKVYSFARYDFCSKYIVKHICLTLAYDACVWGKGGGFVWLKLHTKNLYCPKPFHSMQFLDNTKYIHYEEMYAIHGKYTVWFLNFKVIIQYR